jgi:hypothetical protein
MRAVPPRLPAVLCGALLLAGCGKGASTVATGGPLGRLPPAARPGAVSVATSNTTRLGGVDATVDAAAVARAVYPALTPTTRPQTVVVVDGRDWHAALAASSLASAPLGAALLLSEGDVVPAVSGEALQALAPRGSAALGGLQILRVATSAPLPRPYLERTLPRAQPFVTAVSIEEVLAQAAGRAPRQVIVLPDEEPPAMAMPAAGLAAESGAPILYVSADRVPAPTATALLALKRPAIYVMDAASVSAPVLSKLRTLGHVTELPQGATPAENAIELARYTDAQFGWGVKEPGHGLVFVNAARTLDAPAAALLSASGDYGPPLLLESAGVIPPPLAAYLGDIQPAYTPAFALRPVRGVYNHGWLIGDERAIAAVTQAEIDSLLAIVPRRGNGEPTISSGE